MAKYIVATVLFLMSIFPVLGQDDASLTIIPVNLSANDSEVQLVSGYETEDEIVYEIPVPEFLSAGDAVEIDTSIDRVLVSSANGNVSGSTVLEPGETYYLVRTGAVDYSTVNVDVIDNIVSRFEDFGLVTIVDSRTDSSEHIVSQFSGDSIYLVENAGFFNDEYSTGMINLEQETTYLHAGDYALTVSNGDLSEEYISTDVSVAGGQWTIIVYSNNADGVAEANLFTFGE